MNIKNNSFCYPVEKGKIAVCLMTFGGDEKCLTYCLRYLRKQKKFYNMDFYLLDDANHPLENPPSDCHYWKTYFDRQGNLNGVECAQGMLIEFLKIARESKAEYIMKVDCDMAIRNLTNFLLPLENDPLQVVGFQLREGMKYAAGVTYILPTCGIYNAIKLFHKWHKVEKENAKTDTTLDFVEGAFPDHCPEDWAITRCVAWTNDWKLNLWSNTKQEPSENWLLSPFNFDELRKDGSINPVCLSRYQLYDFVNFGNRYQLEVENPREVAAHCFRIFYNFDLKNTF